MICLKQSPQGSIMALKYLACSQFMFQTDVSLVAMLRHSSLRHSRILQRKIPQLEMCLEAGRYNKAASWPRICRWKSTWKIVMLEEINFGSRPWYFFSPYASLSKPRRCCEIKPQCGERRWVFFSRHTTGYQKHTSLSMLKQLNLKSEGSIYYFAHTHTQTSSSLLVCRSGGYDVPGLLVHYVPPHGKQARDEKVVNFFPCRHRKLLNTLANCGSSPCYCMWNLNM